jgi:hypothetical protein
VSSWEIGLFGVSAVRHLCPTYHAPTNGNNRATLTPIATTESALLWARMNVLTAFVERESLTRPGRTPEECGAREIKLDKLPPRS